MIDFVLQNDVDDILRSHDLGTYNAPDCYLPLGAAFFCHLALIRWKDVFPASSFCVNQGGSFIKHQQGLRFSSVVEI